MNKDNFDAINDKFYDAYMSGATESMKTAAFEVREIINTSCKNDKLIDCGVSIDGSWQHKGFPSLNGVIAANSRDNSKVINAAVLSKFCKGCQIWGKRMDGTIAYEQWKCTHNCQINHKGFSHSFLPSPLKLGGRFLFSKFGQRGDHKKLLRNRGVS